MTSVAEILQEDDARMARVSAPYDPIGGDAADPGRFALDIKGLHPERVHVPEAMRHEPLVAALVRCGGVDGYIDKEMHAAPNGERRKTVHYMFDAVRIRHDFAYWAAAMVKIKPKGGGADVPFVLNRPQRKLVEALESMRRADLPIRLVVLKARQWGGSTCVQLYMAWLQLVHDTGLNSLIVAHQGMGTDEIKDMFDRMLSQYPAEHYTDADGEVYKGKRMESVGNARGTYRLNGRNCKVKLGSAERPNSMRGGDYNLIHFSEVGLWPETPMRSAADLSRAATSGVLARPKTMIVYESTANGTGNFFHREYVAARDGTGHCRPLFVAWHEIEQYTLPPSDRTAFAESLLAGKDCAVARSDREPTGAYLWRLWQRGATLAAINWYVTERRKYSADEQMAAEYPSDDIEAFAHSGAKVFDRECVEALRPGCRAPLFRAEAVGNAASGPGSTEGVHLLRLEKGGLKVWAEPAVPQPGYAFRDRYLVVVDIGGRGAKADYTVIAVFDRMPSGGGAPEIVAQWRGHTDFDLLAWNAVRIARLYCDALLVIESNTLETRDPERLVDGDQSHYLLNQLRSAYGNLYARRQSEMEIRQGAPVRYGFHTNVATKPMVISVLVRAIREAEYVERDEDCLKEYLTYEQRPNGSYGALAGHHDDILMTRAIGLHVSCNEMPAPRLVHVSSGSRPKPRGYGAF